MAVQGGGLQRRWKRVQLSADYYNRLREELASQGPIKVERAGTTKINMSGVWKKWKLFCKTVKQDPIPLLKSLVPGDYMAFFKWILDYYPRVRKKSSVHQYWRVFKMLYKEYANGWLDEDLIKDVNNYITILKKYKLDVSVREKSVLSLDDLLRVLHYHWVLDTWVYPDEEQRLLFALLFLFAAYTGSRPCSLIDATVKSLDKCTEDNMEEEKVYLHDYINEDDEYKSKYWNDSEDDAEEFSFADADSEELKSVLYKHVPRISFESALI